MNSLIFRRSQEILQADRIRNLAQEHQIGKGETLFVEGEQPEYLYLITTGTCMRSRDAKPLGEGSHGDLLDFVATLGGESHSQRVIALSDVVCLRWRLDRLWQDDEFSKIVRAEMAAIVLQAQERIAHLQAPIRFQPYSSQLYPGPFVFPNSTILFVFCSAHPEELKLPSGVSRMGKGVLIGIADFPDAYYHHQPNARFSYTETTVFVPVRVGARLGLYVAYIAPSSYEPILLGREIYGFPKQQGETTLHENSASLFVADQEQISVSWQHTEDVSEARIVGAFGQLFGVTGRVTAAAFAVGDALLNMMHVPFYRRVSVFNHKQIPGTETKYGAPNYDVDQLTQAIFSVEHWQNIQRIPDLRIDRVTGIFRDWQITVSDAFHTRLTMRLSTGKILRDYLNQP